MCHNAFFLIVTLGCKKKQKKQKELIKKIGCHSCHNQNGLFISFYFRLDFIFQFQFYMKTFGNPVLIVTSVTAVSVGFLNFFFGEFFCP